MSKSTISMVIFNSYVKLPEGTVQNWRQVETLPSDPTQDLLEGRGREWGDCPQNFAL